MKTFDVSKEIVSSFLKSVGYYFKEDDGGEWIVGKGESEAVLEVVSVGRNSMTLRANYFVMETDEEGEYEVEVIDTYKLTFDAMAEKIKTRRLSHK